MFTLNLDQSTLSKVGNRIIKTRIFYLVSDGLMIESVYSYLFEHLPKSQNFCVSGYRSTKCLNLNFKFVVPELKPGEFIVILNNIRGEAIVSPKKFNYESDNIGENVLQFINLNLTERNGEVCI